MKNDLTKDNNCRKFINKNDLTFATSCSLYIKKTLDEL